MVVGYLPDFYCGVIIGGWLFNGLFCGVVGWESFIFGLLLLAGRNVP
jgi:hypothetical protein